MSIRAEAYEPEPGEAQAYIVLSCDTPTCSDFIQLRTDDVAKATLWATAQGWEFRPGMFPTYMPVAICFECVKVGRA
jgi:hypothetical protein